MAQFLTKLDLSPRGDGRNWVLLAQLEYVTDDGKEIAVPAGFITDLTSVPRIFWNILPSAGQVYDCAAVIHDYLYRRRGNVFERHGKFYNRAACDYILLEAMAELGTPLWKRWLIYANVRAFGWIAWNQEPRPPTQPLEPRFA